MMPAAGPRVVADAASPAAAVLVPGGARRRAALVLAVLLLQPVTSPAAAGALDECRVHGGQQAVRELTSCLNAARRAAGDDMLEAFLAVEQALAERAGRGAPQSLKQSQRDFERYLQTHCGLAQQLAEAGALAPAQLACEADLLRERAAQLKRLLPAAPAAGPTGNKS